MKETRLLMGMPISIEIKDPKFNKEIFQKAFGYFEYIDEKFSTYKSESEISKINRREIEIEKASPDMKAVLKLSEDTKKLTHGYFDIYNPKGYLDPSGLVKGWAIYNCALLIKSAGVKNFFVEAGGDIQCFTDNANTPWTIGIRNPFNRNENVKILKIKNGGVATSGTYIRGQHIYNPHKKNQDLTEISSLTVIGPNIYEADRFATAAFAMGKEGIYFIEKLEGFEGYAIDKNGLATQTSGLGKYF